MSDLDPTLLVFLVHLSYDVLVAQTVALCEESGPGIFGLEGIRD